MDLIQSLMLFMAVSYSTAVTVAVPPAEMPTATPAPTAVFVTATPEPDDDLIVQITTPVPATPTPTASPTPNITPNASYRILRKGDKGEEVRRMQQRLMELGYLNGNIDGSFGYQTYSAVLAFQKANGLTRDGEAGPATLTKLYEDPNVIPNLAVVTPSPVPTATPRPDGLIPIPEGGTGSWDAIHLHTVLYNGVSITVAHEGYPNSAPQMWLKGNELMFSLNELAEAANWTLVADSGDNFSLQVAGYDLDASIVESALELRVGAQGYFDAYTVNDAGAPLNIYQGDVVSENGKWYVSADFLKKALGAEIVWDEDENTVIIRIAEKGLSQSRD